MYNIFTKFLNLKVYQNCTSNFNTFTSVPVKGGTVASHDMKMDSLILLERLCTSLPTALNFFSDVLLPVLDWWSYMGEGALRYSLNLSTKVLADSPVYFLLHCSLLHLY